MKMFSKMKNVVENENISENERPRKMNNVFENKKYFRK